MAIDIGNADVIATLIHAGLDVDARGIDSTKGPTALQQAAKLNRIEIVRLLITEHGANVNAPASSTGDGLTALEAAAANGRIEIIGLLLASGVETIGSFRR